MDQIHPGPPGRVVAERVHRVRAQVRTRGVKVFLLNTEESGCLPALHYLKEHCASPFDLDKLKELCHVSQTHFFRLFKRLTGVPPWRI